MRYFALLFVTGLALAQSPDAQINGRVTDASGGVLSGARVTVTNTDTGLLNTTQSNEVGLYTVPLLPPGRYAMVVEHAGFQTATRADVLLSVAQDARLNFSLAVGSTSDRIEVLGEAPQVDTSDGTLGTVVDDRRIRDLPLNGRNPVDLAGLAPGVTYVDDSVRTEQRLFLNGGRPTATNFVLDGGSLTFNHRDYGLALPPPDALAEFKLITSGVTAEYGRGFAVLAAVTKAGTNAFHGSAWEFLRNDYLDARSFFSASVPKLRYNQFGGTIGGPIRHNKTFFFATYEGLRIRADQLASATPPTPAELRGDFSATSTKILDPVTKQQFAGNQIPTVRFDPVAAAVLKQFVPLPNRGAVNISQTSAPNNDDQVLGRVDHAFSANNRLNFRYYVYLHQDNTNFPSSSNLPGYSPGASRRHQNTATLEDTHIFSPTSLNTVRLSYARFDLAEGNLVHGTILDFGATDYVYPGGPVDYPSLQVTGRFTLAPMRDRERLSETWDLNDTFTHLRGRHEIKLGFSGQIDRFLYRDDNTVSGQFIFDGSQTGTPLSDFLLGKPRTLNQASPLETDQRSHPWGFFAQDQYKISSRVTVNAGLRYELFPLWTEKRNQVASFSPGAQSKQFPTAPSGLIYATDTRFPYRGDFNNFAPRVGLAWDLRGDGRTAVRASYGISYDPLTAEMAGGVLSIQPYGITNTVNVPFSLSAPYRGILDPYPYNFDPNAVRFVLPVKVPKSFNADVRTPYVQTYSLSLQQQLRSGLMAEIAYVGNVGRLQPYLNEINAAVYGPGATTANTDARRPLAPNFASIGQLYTEANSSYNALQFRAVQRFRHGLTFTTAYTYGKGIDEVTTGGAFAQVTQQGQQDPNNRRGERGPNDYNIAHRSVTSVLYEIPKFSDRKLMQSLFGAWELGGILTAQTGTPVTVVSGKDNSLSGVGFDRPDVVGDPHRDWASRDDMLNQYFNTAAFRANQTGRFGNAGRNIIYGPGSLNLNMSLNKAIVISEALRFQLRLDAFNAANHANFNNPNTTLTSASFGRITGSGSGRVLQVSLKCVF
ncbi:MAG: TonB-dependent receptor [Acidobacteriota bacterium]|nr:TonB-dependent receptor [Acidobacteriota bacterium]